MKKKAACKTYFYSVIVFLWCIVFCASCGKVDSDHEVETTQESTMAEESLAFQATETESFVDANLSTDQVIFRRGRDHNWMTANVPSPGEVKYAGELQKLLADPANENALFDVIISVCTQDEQILEAERQYWKELGFYSEETQLIGGLVPGKVLKAFEGSDRCGYEIYWNWKNAPSE